MCSLIKIFKQRRINISKMLRMKEGNYLKHDPTRLREVVREREKMRKSEIERERERASERQCAKPVWGYRDVFCRSSLNGNQFLIFSRIF